MKAFIIAVWLLEFAHTILTSWMVYESLITNFGASDFAQTFDYVMYISGLISVSITSLVQLFFVYGLHKISSFVVIPLLAATLSLVRLLFYTASTVHNLLHGAQTKHWTWSLFSVEIMTIASDILVAGGLSYSLWKRRILWKAYSDYVSWWPRMIDHLIIISLLADAFICILSTITLIVCNVSRNFAFMALSLVACRLFSVSCLACILFSRNLSQTGDIPSLVVILGSATILR